MNIFKKSIYIVLILLTSLSAAQLAQQDTLWVEVRETAAADSLEYFTADVPAELTLRARTANFIRYTRAIQRYNLTSMDQIFFRLGVLYNLDPTLSNLPTTLRDQMLAETLAKQNLNGGFGNWAKDSSNIISTYQAVQIFAWLGYTSYDKVAISTYLERLRNLVSEGYNSHLLDGDSDVYSTSIGVLTYSLMGMTPPNATGLIDKLQRAQNLNASLVPANEIGGFGMQTNFRRSVFWTSEVSVTSIAVRALTALSTAPINSSAAVSFLRSMQLSSGPFVKNPYVIDTTSSYTAVALQALSLLNSSAIDPVKAESGLRALETSSGGFLLKSISTDPSLRGTYFGVLGLKQLGKLPTNVTATEQYVLNLPFLQDGFGGTPGESPSLRETFDAVAAFSYMQRSFARQADILAYVDTYRNADGGYGLTGSFMDSTSRAVSIYSILNTTMPAEATTIQFIQSLQQTNGGFSKKVSNTTTFTVSTYRAVLSLSLLGAEPLDKQGAINYLLSLQNPDGGFGGYAGDTSDISSTYRAVRALSILGAQPSDPAAAITFLQNSQNLDGGFKRSPSDITRPTNVSHAVYTYSGVRALSVLGAAPLNVSGVYDYVVSLRNRDGGYGAHPDFTSNIAYTFTSLWILSNYHEISGFKLGAPLDWTSTRFNYDNASVVVMGGYAPYIYNVSIDGVDVGSGVLATPTEVVFSTSSLQDGNYSVNVLLTDFTGAQINVTRVLSITRGVFPTSTTTTTSSTSTTSNTTTTTTSPTSSTTSTTATKSNPTSTKTPGLTFLLSSLAVLGFSLLVRRRKR